MVQGKTTARHTSADFVTFLGEVVGRCAPDQEIHIILDNLSAHKTSKVAEFLAQHPNVTLHFTPTYSSWLNQVELWFSKVQRDVLARVSLLRKGAGMPKVRTSMRKIREVLRLSRGLGLSQRQVARSVRLGQSTVWDYLVRFRVSGLEWAQVETLDDEALERQLFPSKETTTERSRTLPDWPAVHQELTRKGVTLSLLWQEYRERQPAGYGYSRWCERYRAWKQRLDVSLRQAHVGGEKLFVDDAGATMPVVDPTSGESRPAQIFVAVLGASNYTYADATWSQDLRDWLGSHIRAFEAIGGVVELVVPDNLKSGVTTPHWYERR